MTTPLRAAVRPRVRRDGATEASLLEDEVRDLLAGGGVERIAIVGGPGSGKSTALAHLAAVLPDVPLRFVDAGESRARARAQGSVVVFATRVAPVGTAAALALEPWCEDDWIEFLLSRHRDRCASVLARVHASPDADDLLALPETCAAVLDALASDEEVPHATAALAREVESRSGLGRPERVARLCLRATSRDRFARAWARLGGVSPVRALVRHPAAFAALGAHHLARALCEGRLPRPRGVSAQPRLAARAGRLFPRDAAAVDRVEALRRRQTNAAQPGLCTFLHHAAPGWRPSPSAGLRLAGAILAGADWSEIDLAAAELDDVDLSRARLCGARLVGATAAGARFDGALLGRADLSGIRAPGAAFRLADLREARVDGARLSRANLSGASLDGASLRRASIRDADLGGVSAVGADATECDLRHSNLAGAVLSRAQLQGARLAGCDLRGAAFAGAVAPFAEFVEANLEEVEWPDAALDHARLDGAYLTGARLPRARLEGASLRGARLADVHLSRADLRDADLRDCAFHLGSARSGLVSSPLASEGTRTGFYADDFVEMAMLDPEAVRKADLRGCDLRGARIDGTDFFLVDLRGARLDATVVPTLRAMRAILDDDPAR